MTEFDKLKEAATSATDFKLWVGFPTIYCNDVFLVRLITECERMQFGTDFSECYFHFWRVVTDNALENGQYIIKHPDTLSKP